VDAGRCSRTNFTPSWNSYLSLDMYSQRNNEQLLLAAREVISEARATARGRRHKPSPGLRLHGQYIGLIQNLSTRKKARVRAVRARKGVEAAIKMAREMRSSR
jgi:hypothetical protein